MSTDSMTAKVLVSGRLAGRQRYVCEVPKIRRLRVLTLSIIAYMLLAFAWWSVLLFIKNKDAFEAKARVLEMGMAAEQLIDSRAELEATNEYIALFEEYNNDNLQIFGEAVVFIITLVLGVYLVNRSYRKEVEAAKQQRNFLLSITHELKSPLAGIRLALETFQKRELQPAQRERLTTSALGETTRLTSLVEDLLLSAKLDTSYEPNLEPLDIGELAHMWIERMQIKYPHLNFTLSLEGDEFSVLADHYGISSVLSNLLENAVKYIGDGQNIEVVVCERGDDVNLEVRDDGVGIPDEEKERVLEKFYRVGNEDTRSTKGTGLGLYIVNEVIHAHHGHVSLRDNEPKGTVFDICLPFGETA